MFKKQDILDYLVRSIRRCHKDLREARGNWAQQDYIEGFRCRLDELLLMFEHVYEISFVEACKRFEIPYEEVNWSTPPTSNTTRSKIE